MQINLEHEFGDVKYGIDHQMPHRETICSNCDGVGKLFTLNQEERKCPRCEGRKVLNKWTGKFVWGVFESQLTGINIQINEATPDQPTIEYQWSRSSNYYGQWFNREDAEKECAERNRLDGEAHYGR